MNVSRREFLLSSGAAFLTAGCRTAELFGAPDLRFGVVSDMHISTPKSCRMFERALRQFKRRGVDAVVIPGDLTDWGLKSGFVYVRRTWDKVFGGTAVTPLFCTGNHDFDGWRYSDISVEMRVNGYSETDRLGDTSDPDRFAKGWEEVFGEKFEWVRCRTVKGYDFVSAEYGRKGSEALAAWMKANGARFADGKPFFFFQHLQIKGTTADSRPGRGDGGATKPVLDPFPNCVAFTGHAHRPFTDERQIWQGEFTAVGTPSLSYASLPSEVPHENGRGDRKGDSAQTMQIVPNRRDLRGGQGYVVDVWPDKIVIGRTDIEEDAEGAPAWVVPLPLGGAKPFAVGVRENAEPVPCFPAGAALVVETRNTENRAGHWAIVMNCEFPSAVVPRGHRVFDYEIRAVPKDGSAPTVKYFFSPAYAKMAKFEPARQRFWFNVEELPKGREYVIEVRARNCFGAKSRPLVSDVWRGTLDPEKA